MRRLILACTFSLLVFPAFGKTSLKDLTFKSNGQNSQVVAHFSETLSGMPRLEVKDSIIQLVFPDIQVWPKVDKKVGVQNELGLTAYQFDTNTARLRVVFPYSIIKFKDRISVTVRKDKVKLNFPYENSAPAPIIKKSKVFTRNTHKAPENHIKKLDHSKSKVNLPLDESYLNSLMKKNEDKQDVEKVAPELSAQEKETPKKEFNLNTYIAKFIFFLSIIIGGFLITVKLFKKGAFSKSKLNIFSADSELVKVINTTYLAPKKSIILVKVHQQLLLLSNSDSGISFLSEIHDHIGALKTGESEVVGNNFDDLVKRGSETSSKVNEKEDIYESKNKFSDEIKRKLKTLKPLQ